MASDRRGAHVLGRYVLHDEFASGGMAAVHFGRLVAEAGFTRTVAIKRLHPQHAKDPAFVAMLLDEARLAGRIRHPNVAPILDVVQTDGEVFLVMEYVHGDSLSSLSRATVRLGSPIPARLAASVVVDALHGLHAAHIATGENGEPLGIVHRDVSPENILVGTDGAARVLDFGIALASGRSQVTREGGLKGKLGYMAPELLEGTKATPISDVYSVGVVLWEALAGQRLFTGEHEGAILARVLKGATSAPSERAALPPGIDHVVMRALSRSPRDRYPSADDFAIAIETAFAPAPARDVAAWVRSVAGASLAKRAAMLAEVESARPRARPEPAAVARPAVATEVLETLPVAVGTPSRTRVIGPTGEHLVTEVLQRGPAQEVTGAGNLARDASVRHARRTGAIVIAAISAVALLVVAIALASNGSDAPAVATADASAKATGSASASSSPSTAAPPPPRTSAPAVTVAPAAASAVPSATAAASTDSAAPSSEPRTRTRPRPMVTAHPPPNARPTSCDPPYTIDERGVHHYKPGCL